MYTKKVLAIMCLAALATAGCKNKRHIPDSENNAGGNTVASNISASSNNKLFANGNRVSSPILKSKPQPKPQPKPIPASSASGCGSSTDASGKWLSVKCYEFKEGRVPSGWYAKNDPNHLDSHLSYLPNNVSFSANEYAVITTRRHCVNKKGDPLTSANATTGVCPSGKVTQYSGGRLESDGIVDSSKPFRAEIRAKINWNGLHGMRTALWLNKSSNNGGNGNISVCKKPGGNAPYGSLLILEWFSATPDYAWPASSISCYYSNALKTWRTRNFVHRLENRVTPQRSEPLTGKWHVWAIEFDGKKVRYFMDGELVPVHHYRSSDRNVVNVIDSKRFDEHGRYPSTMPDEDHSKLGISPELLRKVFQDDKWHFVLNDYAEWESELDPPSTREPFPIQTTQIDYVRLYRKN